MWDSFFLNGLLLDFKEPNDILELEHNVPDHAARLRPAIQAHNERMVGPGQELWNHTCEVCCASRELDGHTGMCSFNLLTGQTLIDLVEMLWAAVTDSVTLSHLCCGVHDCKVPLNSQHNTTVRYTRKRIVSALLLGVPMLRAQSIQHVCSPAITVWKHVVLRPHCHVPTVSTT